MKRLLALLMMIALLGAFAAAENTQPSEFSAHPPIARPLIPMPRQDIPSNEETAR